MLLIFPPLAKACEPAGGLPILGGALKNHSINYQIVDFNYEGQVFLLQEYFKTHPKKKYYLDLIQGNGGYTNYDKYIKVINELTKGLNYTSDKNTKLTMANYSSSEYDPLNSKDLIEVANKHKDNIFYSFYKLRLTEILSKTNISRIGISLQYLNQAICTFALIGYIKKNYPYIKIVLGGGLITSWSKSSNWNNPFSTIVDKIIPGPGEYEIVNFCNVKPDSLKLKNIVPDYDFTDTYKYFSKKKVIPISGSMGCSWKKCTFCPEKAENNPYVAKKSSQIINEIKYLSKKYNSELIHFLDNEINPHLLKELSVSDNKLPWYGFTKFYQELIDPDFCIKLNKSGCFMLKLGLESGDQKVLDSMNKGINLSDAKIILKNLYNANIKTFIYLLFGTPEEDYNSAKKTLEFILENHKYITYLNLAIFNLPIDSDLAKKQQTFNLSEADLALYTGFKHPKGWNRKDVRDFLNNEFKTNRIIKDILYKTPPVFNANHTYSLKDN